MIAPPDSRCSLPPSTLTFKSFKAFKPFKPFPSFNPPPRRGGGNRWGLERSAAVERLELFEPFRVLAPRRLRRIRLIAPPRHKQVRGQLCADALFPRFLI